MSVLVKLYSDFIAIGCPPARSSLGERPYAG